MRKICVVTGTRADYGLLYPVIKKIKLSTKLTLQLIATNAHLSSNFGMTYKQIEQDGFVLDAKIDNLFSSDEITSMPKSTGLALSLLSKSFKKLRPDVILILGDRYETLAAATAAMLMKIPIAHIHGGESTEGAVDEYIRHSITKMSFLHFCSTEFYRKRVIQMGENPNRVFNTGAPGIDNVLNLKLLTKSQLESELNWKLSSKNALFTYHPVTLSDNNIRTDLKRIFKTLSRFDINILFSYANADIGGTIINFEIEKFCSRNPKKYKVEKNLGQLKYLSAMKHVDLIIGNSSSGIIEAPSFNKPVVNIGDRQKGRLRNENVIDCSLESLEASITLALTKFFLVKCKKIKNIYGNGNASELIVQKLEKHPLSQTKIFFDL
jgi:GDP/UDP-N,N'-diacetylbacillosamine 2-epimerase (hydrolysing)